MGHNSMDTLILNRVALQLASTKITKLSKKENSIEKTDSKHVTQMSLHPQRSSAIPCFERHAKTAVADA